MSTHPRRRIFQEDDSLCRSKRDAFPSPLFFSCDRTKREGKKQEAVTFGGCLVCDWDRCAVRHNMLLFLHFDPLWGELLRDSHLPQSCSFRPNPFAVSAYICSQKMVGVLLFSLSFFFSSHAHATRSRSSQDDLGLSFRSCLPFKRPGHMHVLVLLSDALYSHESGICDGFFMP